MTGRLLAYAQLVRLPNVFTAFADILIGGVRVGVHCRTTRPIVVILLMLASGCLYSAAWSGTTIFDRHGGCRRPGRSDRCRAAGLRPHGGRCSASVLLLLGCRSPSARRPKSATSYTQSTRCDCRRVVVAILLYDAWLKRTPLGPIGDGRVPVPERLLGLSARMPSILIELAAFTSPPSSASTSSA